MLEGWAAMKESGLRVPAVIQNATNQFFFDRNEIDAFLIECAEKEPDAKAAVGDLYVAYCNWCILEAIEHRKQREFGQLLRTVHKLDQERSNWKGIRLEGESELIGVVADGQVSTASFLDMLH
jgi:phage/plasmid-associated DNA primase